MNETEKEQDPVSIIVCARDEEAALAANLPAVLAQEYGAAHEVIVVNDNSFDNSVYTLEALQQTFKNLQVVNLTQEAKHIAGKKYPLSIGIKEAKHEVVLLTDADCTPASTQWMATMQNALANGVNIALGYGAYSKTRGFLNKAIRFETFHTALQYFSYALAGLPYMGVGRNLAYRKELFFRNKGFSSSNHVPGGDDDLFINQVANKHNTTVVLSKDAFTFSTPKQSWRAWWRQKSRHYSTGKFYKFKHKFLLGLYTASHAFFYPLLVLSLFLFEPRYVLFAWALRTIVQGIIWRKAMKILGEEDLFAFFPFWDLWQAFYYLCFAPAVWKKPRKTWD